MCKPELIGLDLIEFDWNTFNFIFKFDGSERKVWLSVYILNMLLAKSLI